MVRHKNRYIIVEITPEMQKEAESFQVRSNHLHFSIIGMVQSLYGDFGVAAIQAGLVSKYCNEKTRVAIIRCRHGPHKFVTSSLPCIRFIEQKRCKITTLYTGATIKRCFRFIQIYQQTKFDQFCRGLKTREEKIALKREIMNLEPLMDIQ